ncbi:helix-turn-helix domain-containing protein [Pontibacter ummariensis]|uniref:helix-turn-helix domain-containing protein n=1 Tax=Pontibacter ummariensis TaxID=1610492 RepID=UPI0015C6817D|nr:AraC family transcriptional regulator [Pontibacter ummariensis]
MRQNKTTSGNSLYSGNCEILHVNDNNCNILEKIKSENCIMSTLSTSLESELRPKGLALKFTAEGLETYWFQKKHFHVSSGKYLLVNETIPAMDVVIKGVPTWGMCVDIDMQLVNDALYQLLYPDDLDGYNSISRFLLSPELFVREAVAGAQLKSLLNKFISISVSKEYKAPGLELIYELITLLIQENREMVSSYYSLQTSKLSTRQELFRRLLLGKEVLDDSLFTDLSMKQVAEACCLSEFRFYRLFKQCFGHSPYNYLFKKRIEKSMEMKKQGLSWSEIAYTLNFTDLAAFSKSFKKIKGLPPSRYPL